MSTPEPRSKNSFDRKILRSPLDWTAFVVGTFFGAGRLPKAPGTWGTLAAVPVTYFLHLHYPNPFDPVHYGFWALLAVVGTWACQHICRITNQPDHQALVIDEVVGYGITAALAGTSWTLLAVAFILFRFFDITKIPPVRQLDRLSKRTTNAWARGFGVMADDLLAGVQGLIVFYFIAPYLIEAMEKLRLP